MNTARFLEHNFFSLLGILLFFLVGSLLFSVKGAQQFKSNKDQSPTMVQDSTTKADITAYNMLVNDVTGLDHFACFIRAYKGQVFKTKNFINGEMVTCQILQDKHFVGELRSKEAFLDQGKQLLFFPQALEGVLFEIDIKAKNVTYDIRSSNIIGTEGLFCLHKNFVLSAGQSFYEIKNNKLILKNNVETVFQ